MSAVSRDRWHMRRHTPEYTAWADMLQRCRNSRHRQFANWGGRGIAVCPEWEDFRVFFADMGLRPPGYTLERKDNNQGYSRANCVWAPIADQHRNTRQTKLITIDGKTQCLKDWCGEYGIIYSTVQRRIKDKWDPVAAITTPPQPTTRIYNRKGD